MALNLGLKTLTRSSLSLRGYVLISPVATFCSALKSNDVFATDFSRELQQHQPPQRRLFSSPSFSQPSSPELRRNLCLEESRFSPSSTSQLSLSLNRPSSTRNATSALSVHCPTSNRNPVPSSPSRSLLSSPHKNANLPPFAHSAPYGFSSTIEELYSRQSRRFSTSSRIDSARSMKRFYESVSIASGGANSFEILLDGKKLKTPSGNVLSVPNHSLAIAVATEWESQVFWIALLHLRVYCLKLTGFPSVFVRDGIPFRRGL